MPWQELFMRSVHATMRLVRHGVMEYERYMITIQMLMNVTMENNRTELVSCRVEDKLENIKEMMP
jgi:hypothetical protein